LLRDGHIGSDGSGGVVSVTLELGTGFVDAAGGVEAEAEEDALSEGVESLIEEELNFVGGEDFGSAVSFAFHEGLLNFLVSLTFLFLI
jgi:hypothetical protein